jgi:signal recognition particle subunit SRP54
MFDNLSDKLQRVFKNLRGEGKLTPENMESALREIRVALLEADRQPPRRQAAHRNIKQKAMGEEVLMSLSPHPVGAGAEISLRQFHPDPHLFAS